MQQLPQTSEELLFSLLFLQPPPTISCTSVLPNSLPIEPVEGRPVGDDFRTGGTEIVKCPGETGLFIDPNIEKIIIRIFWMSYYFVRNFIAIDFIQFHYIPIDAQEPLPLTICPESFVLTVTAGITVSESPVIALPLLLLLPLRIPSEFVDNVDLWLIRLCIIKKCI